MEKTFNLKQYLTKTANMSYDGSQGYFLAHQRAWMNCIKCKQESGESAQKSWQECFDEFQKGDHKLSWLGTYAKDTVEKVTKESASDYSEDVVKFAASGISIGAAVIKAIKQKIAQVPNNVATPPAVASQPEEGNVKIPDNVPYVLRRFDLGKWGYFNDTGIDGDLARAKRFDRASAKAKCKDFMTQKIFYIPVPDNEGDWSKLGGA